MDNINILDWNNISDRYNRSTILLGNGSSIAVSNSFNYGSLLDRARENFNQNGDRLFERFRTVDFELILRMVWQSKEVIDSINNHDCVHYRKLQWVYEDIRNGLIESVRNVHPSYSDINTEEKLQKISNFLRDFDTIISLNYDLIIYWASLNQQDNSYSFKDCFIGGKFYDNWKRLRDPIRGARYCSLIFYPHGNLILYKNNEDILSSEFKFSSNEDVGLLDTILSRWENGGTLPLFISEGVTEQKIKSIKSSYYLSTIYREVLPERKETLVIYGWGFGEQDIHILKQMKECGIRNIAVSVYNENEEYCLNAQRVIRRELGEAVAVDFFHSNSEGCWIF